MRSQLAIWTDNISINQGPAAEAPDGGNVDKPLTGACEGAPPAKGGGIWVFPPDPKLGSKPVGNVVMLPTGAAGTAPVAPCDPETPGTEAETDNWESTDSNVPTLAGAGGACGVTSNEAQLLSLLVVTVSVTDCGAELWGGCGTAEAIGSGSASKSIKLPAGSTLVSTIFSLMDPKLLEEAVL